MNWNLFDSPGYRIILKSLNAKFGFILLATELFKNCYVLKVVWFSWLPSYFKIFMGRILFDAPGYRISLKFLGVEIGLVFLATELFQNLSCIRVGFMLLVTLSH
jgi:hypothetical protein